MLRRGFGERFSHSVELSTFSPLNAKENAMKLVEQYRTLKEAPMHIRAISGVMVFTVIIALIAFGLACVALGGSRNAN
jgi:hypothetical protein